MSVYAISSNGKEFWKMIQGPQKYLDHHQKQWMTKTCTIAPAKSGDNKSSGVLLLCWHTHIQMHGATKRTTQASDHIGVRNKQ